MLPDGTIAASLAGLLVVFRCCFTAPTYRTFTGLVVGLIAQTRRRTVCGMLLGAGLERLWHHSRAHRFFAVARWCTDRIGLAARATWRTTRVRRYGRTDTVHITEVRICC